MEYLGELFGKLREIPKGIMNGAQGEISMVIFLKKFFDISHPCSRDKFHNFALEFNQIIFPESPLGIFRIRQECDSAKHVSQ